MLTITLKVLWFAFKLVSLNHWKQREYGFNQCTYVVICFQISIFEPLETASSICATFAGKLWFAFKLVSLNHWKQLVVRLPHCKTVVICFQISIFEPLETAIRLCNFFPFLLWFAFKLVSLNHWKQRYNELRGQKHGCDLLSN